MRWFRTLGALSVTVALIGAGAAAPVSAAPSAQVTVRLTGLNRAGHVAAVPQAELLEVNGFPTVYQGTAVKVSPGTYIIAAEVPTYAGSTVTSQTLVVRTVSIRKSGTIRLDARHGVRLRVALTGASAQVQDLAALACLANSPGASGEVAQGAWGGSGVAVYAVPTRSAYVSFSYLNILQSAAGARYYLVGSARARGIPSRLSYGQRATGLAEMTMVLRSGAFGSDSFDWGITSGNTLCGGGQNAQVQQPQSWVNYLTPGTWATDVQAYSQGRNASLYRSAAFGSVRQYRAGGHYTDVFGGAAAGPRSNYPAMASDQFEYDPSLFGSPVADGGLICCSLAAVTLRLGKHVVKKENVSSSSQSPFLATLHQAGWYNLAVTARRWFDGGNTPADLLSPSVAVSFRFHASPTPPGTGNWQNFPVTDTEYQPLGLNLDNRAAAGGMTKIEIQVLRPGNAGTPTPAYRITSIRVFASVNGGATWQALAVARSHGSLFVTMHDPATGYVSLRSVVTDVHGDRTEQTVYRAYAVN
jgi:hypothetical protein